jgi:hypothetical protein
MIHRLSNSFLANRVVLAIGITLSSGLLIYLRGFWFGLVYLGVGVLVGLFLSRGDAMRAWFYGSLGFLVLSVAQHDHPLGIGLAAAVFVGVSVVALIRFWKGPQSYDSSHS